MRNMGLNNNLSQKDKKQKSKWNRGIKFLTQKKVLTIIGFIITLFAATNYIININSQINNTIQKNNIAQMNNTTQINSGNQINLQNSQVSNSTITQYITSATPKIESENFIADGNQQKFILKKSFIQYSTDISINGVILIEGESAHYIENLTDHSIEFLYTPGSGDTINIKYTVI